LCVLLSPQAVELSAEFAELQQLPCLFDTDSCKLVVSSLRNYRAKASLEGLRQLGRHGAAQALRQGLSRARGDEADLEKEVHSILLTAFDSWPHLKQVSARVREGGGGDEGGGWIEPEGAVEGTQCYPLPRQADCEVEIFVHTSAEHADNLRKKGSKHHSSNGAGARSKSKVTWWAMVGTADGELLALKRVGVLPSQHTPVRLCFTTPSAFAAAWPLRIHVVNDTVLGIDVTSDVKLHIY
jgi:hypothetical protein